QEIAPLLWWRRSEKGPNPSSPARARVRRRWTKNCSGSGPGREKLSGEVRPALDRTRPLLRAEWQRNRAEDETSYAASLQNPPCWRSPGLDQPALQTYATVFECLF